MVLLRVERRNPVCEIKAAMKSKKKNEVDWERTYGNLLRGKESD